MINAELLVGYMLQEGTEETSEGDWIFYFKELSKFIELKKSVIELIENLLLENERVMEVEVDEECIHVYFALEYCPNLKDEREE